MSCDHFKNLIVKQLASSADKAEAESVRAHLDGCEACRQYQHESAATWTELDVLIEKDSTESRAAEIVKQITTTRATRLQDPKPQDWRSSALAAAVLLVLAGGLFAMVARREPVAVKSPIPADGDGEKKKETKPENPDSGLTEAELQAIGKFIIELDAEDFDLREAAAKKLVAMGPKIKAFLAARLEKPEPKDSENLLHGIKTVIASIEKSETERAIAETIKDLELAIKEAPAHFVPPDPAVVEKLKKTVSFEFTEKPIGQAIGFISESAGVPIVLDPSVPDLEATPITLRVNQMSADLALEWILKLGALDKVVRGKAVIVSTPERALKLALQNRAYTVPVGDGEIPWTEEETRRLLPFLKQSGDNDSLSMAELSVEKAGTVTVRGAGACHQAVEKALPELTTERLLQIPAWFDEMEPALNKRLAAEFDHAHADEATVFLFKHSGLNIIVDPKCAAAASRAEVDYHAGERSVRELLLLICEQSYMAIAPVNGSLLLTRFPDLATQCCVIDLKPALKAHVPVAELRERLDGLCQSGQIIRNRWYANTDAWTCQRAVALVGTAAKTGKVPELPAQPWFLKTFTFPEHAPPARPAPEIPKTPDLDGDPNGDDGKIVPKAHLKK